MKKLLTILCLVLLISCSDQPPPEPPPEVPYEVPSHRLINNGGMTFEIGSNDPFTGVSIEYHKNGELKSSKNYKNGREVNTTIFDYHDNGQLWSKGNVINGKPDGLYEMFYDNDQLSFRGNYKDGESDGLHEWFYKNNQLDFRGNYKDASL